MNDLVFFNKNAKKLCDNVNNHRSVWPPKVEDREILNQYLESRNFVSNKNDKISQIENNMSNFLGTKYFSFFDSGASALHSALVACGVTYGDEVIVPAWTFAAPAFQVLRVGAIPIFAYYITNAVYKLRIVKRHEYIVYHAIVDKVDTLKLRINNSGMHYEYDYCSCVGIRAKNINKTKAILIFVPDDLLLFPDNEEKNKY